MRFLGTMAISFRLSSTFSSSLPVSLSSSNVSRSVLTPSANPWRLWFLCPLTDNYFGLIVYQMGRNTKVAVTEKKCNFCFGSIELLAVRCSKCTSWLDMDEYARAEELKTMTVNVGHRQDVQKTEYVDYGGKSASLSSIR